MHCFIRKKQHRCLVCCLCALFLILILSEPSVTKKLYFAGLDFNEASDGSGATALSIKPQSHYMRQWKTSHFHLFLYARYPIPVVPNPTQTAFLSFFHSIADFFWNFHLTNLTPGLHGCSNNRCLCTLRVTCKQIMFQMLKKKKKVEWIFWSSQLYVLCETYTSHNNYSKLCNHMSWRPLGLQQRVALNCSRWHGPKRKVHCLVLPETHKTFLNSKCCRCSQ